MSEPNEIEQEEPVHEMSFLDIAGMFFNQGAIALGAAPHPMTGQQMVSFEAAHESIAILEILHEKTQGNLSEQEQSVLENLISELKMAFVQAVRDPRAQEIAERTRAAAGAEPSPSMIITPDGRPASAAGDQPRIIVP